MGAMAPTLLKIGISHFSLRQYQHLLYLFTLFWIENVQMEERDEFYQRHYKPIDIKKQNEVSFFFHNTYVYLGKSLYLQSLSLLFLQSSTKVVYFHCIVFDGSTHVSPHTFGIANFIINPSKYSTLKTETQQTQKYVINKQTGIWRVSFTYVLQRNGFICTRNKTQIPSSIYHLLLVFVFL